MTLEVVFCRLVVFVLAHIDGSVDICILGRILMCEVGWFHIIDMVYGGEMGMDRWVGFGMRKLLWEKVRRDREVFSLSHKYRSVLS